MRRSRDTLWLGAAGEANLLRGSCPTTLDIRFGGPHYLLGYPLSNEDRTMAAGHRRPGWAWYDSTRNGLLKDWGAVAGDVVQHSVRPPDVPDTMLASLQDQARQLWPEPWRNAIVDSITCHDVTGTPIAEYIPTALVSGRAALVGDAAHAPTPMTGRGLAECL